LAGRGALIGEAKARRVRVAVVAVVVALVVAVAVAYPWTYGAKGDLRLFLEVDPGPHAWPTREQVVATVTLENIGQTTVRVVPLGPATVILGLEDPNGTHVPSNWDLMGAPLFSPSDLVEVPPGGLIQLRYALGGGGFAFTTTGLYNAKATYHMSDTSMDGSALPYWAGVLESAPAGFALVP